MRMRAIGTALAAAGGIVATLWASGRMPHPFAPVLALMLVTAGASCFSKVSRLAERLAPMVEKIGEVKVYGSALPGVRGSVRVEKVLAIGAGLHFYLRPMPDGSSLHLKIAQPSEVAITEAGVEVAQAKYVQWAGRTISRSPGKKPFALVLEDDSSTAGA